MLNPLLHPAQTPTFSDINPEEHIESALTQILADNRRQLAELLQQETFTWENLIVPLHEMEDRLEKMWSPVSHLNLVLKTDAWGAAHDKCLTMKSEYDTELSLNSTLYKAFLEIENSDAFQHFSPEKKRVIQLQLKNFRIDGAHLSEKKKQKLIEIEKQLTAQKTAFKNNVLAATEAWTLHVTDIEDLKGLPESDIANALEEAKTQNKEGWILTLKLPVYIAVMKLCANRAIRQKMYQAFVAIASDQGPNAGQWDNSPVIENILRLRHENASLLNFANFADYSLANKMAEQTAKVSDFLQKLAAKSVAHSKIELAEIKTLAEQDGIQDFSVWDINFYCEKLRVKKYQISQETLRPYFPLSKVLSGYFSILQSIFGLSFKKVQAADVWHEDVFCYEVYDEANEFRGSVYMDLFSRSKKRTGAWMDVCRTRRELPDGTMQYPIAYLSTNFANSSDGKPVLLTEANIVTLFHEFGHCLHHILTKMQYRTISGISGVPWDGVEFPSKFMESFCFQKETIHLISGHYETGEPLPADMLQRMLDAKNFMSAAALVRQLEFSLFDLRIHMEPTPPSIGRVMEILRATQDEVAIMPSPDFARFGHSFAHIFAGGYAAGYYTYKWSEVLACDAFFRFEESGKILNAKIGREFMKAILQQGGFPDFMSAFVSFRGRPPKVEALLRDAGLDVLPVISNARTLASPLLFKPAAMQQAEEEKPAAQAKAGTGL